LNTRRKSSFHSIVLLVLFPPALLSAVPGLRIVKAKDLQGSRIEYTDSRKLKSYPCPQIFYINGDLVDMPVADRIEENTIIPQIKKCKGPVAFAFAEFNGASPADVRLMLVTVRGKTRIIGSGHFDGEIPIDDENIDQVTPLETAELRGSRVPYTDPDKTGTFPAPLFYVTPPSLRTADTIEKLKKNLVVPLLREYEDPISMVALRFFPDDPEAVFVTVVLVGHGPRSVMIYAEDPGAVNLDTYWQALEKLIVD
jgi:hypothetical protein